MLFDYQNLSHAGIRTLTPYVPGKSAEALTQEENLSTIIKLASNENPLGCSEHVKAALTTLGFDQFVIYPDQYHHPLHQKLCDKLGIEKSMLILENGSDAFISLILIAFALHTGKKTLVHQYAFMAYSVQAQMLGIPVISIPLQDNWKVDIDAMIQASQEDIGVLFLANPNNPTGVMIEFSELERLLANVPSSTIVVLDEAYHEYASLNDKDNCSINLLKKYPNLVITRTFSKAYGLAGLRLGYAVAHPQIVSLLFKIHLPFTVNQAALLAGYVALDDQDFIHKTVETNKAGMQQLNHGLTELKLDLLPSHGNFVFFDCGRDALSIYQQLLNYGIIVRPLHAYGLPNHLRVTVGKAIHNEAFLDKLALSLNEPQENIR